MFYCLQVDLKNLDLQNGDVVSNPQAGFISGRSISDNILLASKLVKCYLESIFPLDS